MNANAKSVKKPRLKAASAMLCLIFLLAFTPAVASETVRETRMFSITKTPCKRVTKKGLPKQSF